MIVLDDRRSEPLYLQIYKQIKEGIISAQLPEGGRLPSTRVLAATLGVGRNTVEYAYLQLCSEGYLTSKAGSGFIVQKLDGLPAAEAQKPDPQPAGEVPAASGGNDYRYNFQYGKLNAGDFPFSLWRKLTGQSLAAANIENMVSYNDRQGEPGLRAEIAGYLHSSRGVVCRPDQVILCAGTQPCLSLLCQLFRRHSTAIAVEEPAYDGARDVFVNNGFDVLPVDVGENGISLEMLEKSAARIVYITPSHQFPTGAVMPIQQRLQLLDWANRKNGIIIEDDYDSELRYNTRPIPSVQCSDPGNRVVYIGTFSKTLAPALRMSYMVLPPQWLEIYRADFAKYNSPVPWLQQKVLELFMAGGHWERHLRKVSLANKKKHDILLRTLNELMGDKVTIHGRNAGLHVLLELNGRSEQELIEKARSRGVVVYPVSRYWLRPDRYAGNMILLGFSGLSESDIVAGVRLLNSAWFG